MSLYTAPVGTNIEATAQRTDILHFMDVTSEDKASSGEVWQQLGAGFTSMTESPSAQTKERKYINSNHCNNCICTCFALLVYIIYLACSRIVEHKQIFKSKARCIACDVLTA